MNKENSICVDRRETPREPVETPLPDDTLFVWVTGVVAAVSILLTAVWIVSLM